MVFVGFTASVLTLTAVMINWVCFTDPGKYRGGTLRARVSARYRSRPRMFVASLACSGTALVLCFVYFVANFG